ncbi:unnamed protein product [Peniophora sp. CBMAI 1063]|nr:unnamed protein product [Peniophora sp. CBMAI 1063]
MTLGATPLPEYLEYVNKHPERLRLIETRRVQWDPAVLAGRTLPLLERALLVPKLHHTGHHPDVSPLVIPRLEELTLTRFYIPFVAPNLRSLFIYSLVPFQLEVFVTMLNALPTLTSLRLDNCLPNILVDGQDVGRIALPRISNIDLRQSTCTGLITFLELLRPNGLDISITLSIGYASKSQAEYAHLAAALHPFMHGTSRDTVDLNFEPPDYTPQPSFAVYQSTSNRNSGRTGEISVRVEDCAEDVTPLFASLLEQFAISQIRHLVLLYGENLDEGMPTHDFRRLLRAPLMFAESLKTVRYDIRHPLFDQQHTRSRICTLLFDGRTTYPHLKELILSGSACLCVLTDQEGASKLLSWLKDRRAAGSPLKTLRLRGLFSLYYNSQIEALAEDVVWRSIRANVAVVDEWEVLGVNRLSSS